MNSDPLILETVAQDGASNRITVYRTARHKAAPLILIFPAMGVTAAYYEPLAKVLNEAGFNAATTDLRGLGQSSVRVKRGVDFGYHDMVTMDYTAAISALKERFPQAPLFILGHSLGGQLAALWAASNPQDLKGLILIATCSVYYKKWPFPKRIGLLFFEQLIAAISAVIGYFPGHRLGFGGKEARTQMLDWASQGWTGRYEPKAAGIDYEALLGQATFPVLSISFSDDGYCPEAACRHLAQKMSSSRLTFHNYTPDSLNEEWIGHFGWVKKSYILRAPINNWVESVLNRGA